VSGLCQTRLVISRISLSQWFEVWAFSGRLAWIVLNIHCLRCGSSRRPGLVSETWMSAPPKWLAEASWRQDGNRLSCLVIRVFIILLSIFWLTRCSLVFSVRVHGGCGIRAVHPEQADEQFAWECQLIVSTALPSGLVLVWPVSPVLRLRCWVRWVLNLVRVYIVFPGFMVICAWRCNLLGTCWLQSCWHIQSVGRFGSI